MKVSPAYFMNNSGKLLNSRVEIAAAAHEAVLRYCE